MFGKLKDKLKSWVSKNEEEEIEKELTEKTLEETEKEEEKAKPEKKEIKKKEKKAKPEKTEKTKEKSKKELPKKGAEKKSKEETKEKSKEESEKSEKEIKDQPEEKKSFFSKFKKKETKEEENKEKEPEESPKKEKKKLGIFQSALTEEKFEELFEELQLILLQHNVAYEAVESIEEHLKENLIGERAKSVNITKELRTAIENLLINPPNFIDEIKNYLGNRQPATGNRPYIILFAGINGSGKTTTIAKVANLLQKNNLKVCLAASDTFRAAAIQQLEEHGKNLGIPVIKKDYGSDPASVGFDAIKYAKKHNLDVVLIDTAGRMQNSDTLMKEIEKITRVTSPDMKIFLGESTTGNDATLQAKAFNESIGLTGIILSKADVDESGGTAISVSHVAKVPILFLGTGQTYDDLEIFDKESLLEKLGL